MILTGSCKLYKYLAFNKKEKQNKLNAEERKQKKSNDRAGKEPSTRLDKSKHNRDLGTNLGTKLLRKKAWRATKQHNTWKGLK